MYVPLELWISCAIFLFADICQTKGPKFDRVGEYLVRWRLGLLGGLLPQQLSVLSITILNISSGIGRCCTGFFADRIGPTNTLFAVVLISGLVQLLVWNFANDYPGIVSAFERDVDISYLTLAQVATSALYGFFGVCFWSLATPVGSTIPSIPADPSLKLFISTAAWFYGTENLAGLSGLLFLFAAPGE